MQLKNGVAYECAVVRQPTPDGELYLTIIEDNDHRPVKLFIEIGKSGSSIRAWTDAFQRIASLVLDNGGSIDDIISELSGITSGFIARDSGAGAIVNSGPSGIVRALEKYKADKYVRFIKPELDKTPAHGVLHNR